MDEEIVLARESEGFRIVAGHRRLGAALVASDEAFANVTGEPGRAKVFRTPQGLQVCKDSRNLPLLPPVGIAKAFEVDSSEESGA